MNDTPFRLPRRAAVTTIRDKNVAALRALTGERTQELPGFEPQWRDIVDYIVGITEEIWSDRRVDRIHDTYTADCIVHTSLGTVRGIAPVIAGTVQSLWAHEAYVSEHRNVAWSADGDDFYTSHLGYATMVNIAPTSFGPATGAVIARHFCADCVSRDNKIHTEWLARDNGAIVRQMGLEPLAVAQAMAQTPAAPPLSYDAGEGVAGDPDTPEGYVAAIAAAWNARAFADLAERYAGDAVARWPGGRVGSGPREIARLPLGLIASIPDASFRAEHVSWSEESDGPIVAVRWRVDGTCSPFGMLGPMPAGRPVSLIGMSHWRFGNGRIVEEVTVFDEVAVLVQALRG